LQHQQGGGLRQSLVLAAHIALQLVVFCLQFAQCRAAFAHSRLSAGTKGFAPGLQLVLKQALLAAPGVQCRASEPMALIEGLQALSRAPLLRRQVARQGDCPMGQSPCSSRLRRQPTLEGGQGNIQFISNALLGTWAALAQLAQGLFSEFLGVGYTFHVCRFGGSSALKKSGDN